MVQIHTQYNTRTHCINTLYEILSHIYILYIYILQRHAGTNNISNTNPNARARREISHFRGESHHMPAMTKTGYDYDHTLVSMDTVVSQPACHKTTSKTLSTCVSGYRRWFRDITHGITDNKLWQCSLHTFRDYMQRCHNRDLQWFNIGQCESVWECSSLVFRCQEFVRTFRWMHARHLGSSLPGTSSPTQSCFFLSLRSIEKLTR